MVASSSISVTLTPELEQFIQDQISAGQYPSASELVQEGLLLLKQQRGEMDAEFVAIKTKLERASQQADRGEFVTIDHVMDRIAKAKESRAAGRS